MNKSFPLAIVNAAEDIPRIIRAFANLGRERGECALVIRPLENRAVIVHQHNGQAWQWIGERSDVVRPPEEPISPEGALSLLRQAQQNKGKQGDISFRSQWKGRLFCEDGKPRIHLERKIATYGILHIDSDAKSGKWKWHLERTEKWFSKPGKQNGTSANLVHAIQQGMATAMGLLGEACSFRDSRRRAAFDGEYAERHPIRPAAEKKDPVERFKPKKAKATRRSTRTSTKAKPPEGTAGKGAGARTSKVATSKTTASKATTGSKSTGTSKASNGKTANGRTSAAKSSGKSTQSKSTNGNGKTSRSTSSRSNGNGRKTSSAAKKNGGKTASGTKKSTTRTATSRALSPASAPASPPATTEIDPAKDKLLMDAFGAALQQALAQMGS